MLGCMELKDYERQRLSYIRSILGLAGDIAHAQINLYLNSLQERKLLLLDIAKPETAFVYYREQKIGEWLAYVDEPLVAHTFERGLAMNGKREFISGTVTNMYLHPLKHQGRVYAVLAFEYLDSLQCYPNQQIFMKVAVDLLESADIGVDDKLYSRLSARDGIMIIDKAGTIIGVNNIIQNIYLTKGVHNIVSRRLADRNLHLEAILESYNDMQPAAFELCEHKQVFAQRLLPIGQPKVMQYAVLVMADITDLKKRDQQLLVKSAVIKEIHHRVKNNLQTIASLLRMQARRSNCSETKQVLKESIHQILSISIVHEFLSQQEQDLINVKVVAESIFKLIVENMVNPNIEIKAIFEGEDLILPSDKANSIALIVNEITQNAVEHAFVGRQRAVLTMKVFTEGEYYVIQLQDDGVGLSKGFSLDNPQSMGLQIVKTLVTSDLQGEFTLEGTGEGTLARIKMLKTVEG